MIYFCHIPRTSGTSIEKDVHSKFNRDLKILTKIEFEKYSPFHNLTINKEELESFVINCYSNIDFLNCHLASTPYIEPYCKNLQTFSIIREPIDRIISEFHYRHRSTTDKNWINYEIFNVRNFINYNANSQCLWLFGSFKWDKTLKNRTNINIFWLDLEMGKVSFEKILQIIKKRNIKLSTIENRVYLLNELEICLNKIKKTNITLDKKIIVNENPYADIRKELDNIECFLSDREIENIKIANSLDYQLYNYVKDHETKTGRCLTPDDILF